MATLDELGFEIERRAIVFHRDTTMPDDTQLGYTGDPNGVVNGGTPGETLLYNSPSGAQFLDKGQDPYVKWTKIQDVAGGLWVQAGAGGGGGEYVETEIFTLTATDIANASVQVANTPTDIQLWIRNAPVQEAGSDYKQDDTFLETITWEGFALDGLLQEGDIITITYTRDF